jgi:hypothetical protein
VQGEAKGRGAEWLVVRKRARRERREPTEPLRSGAASSSPSGTKQRETFGASRRSAARRSPPMMPATASLARMAKRRDSVAVSRAPPEASSTPRFLTTFPSDEITYDMIAADHHDLDSAARGRLEEPRASRICRERSPRGTASRSLAQARDVGHVPGVPADHPSRRTPPR